MPYSKKELKQHIRECKRIIRLLNKFYKYPNCGDAFSSPLFEVVDKYEWKLKFYKYKLLEANKR